MITKQNGERMSELIGNIFNLVNEKLALSFLIS